MLETQKICLAPSMGESGAYGEQSATNRWFTTTHWSVVLAAKRNDSAEGSKALERLCRTYWPPLYGYIRRDGHSPEDAQDLTQEFFARLVEKDYLGYLEDQRGKFRSFLLTLLKHFLSDQRAKAGAQKRGGGKAFVSLDDTSAVEADYQIEATHDGNPEHLYERQWAKRVLEQALGRLRQEYVSEGKAVLFEQLKDLQPGEHGATSYVQIGTQLGMSEAAIKSAVHRMRRRHGELLREEIAQTVSRPEEVNEEIRYLLRVLGG
jgi:RNA polymerase sigma factor (sigma-70 family)